MRPQIQKRRPHLLKMVEDICHTRIEDVRIISDILQRLEIEAEDENN